MKRRTARSGRKQLVLEMLESRRLLAAELVSRIPAGLESPYGNENSGIADFTNARGLSLSADGRFVAYSSSATNLVLGDTNQRDDIFLRSIDGGWTERLTIRADGVEGNGASEEPSVNQDASVIVFTSGASNLVATNPVGGTNIYVLYRSTKEFELVSVGLNGSQPNENSSKPTISKDGRYVVFESDASNLVLNDTNGMSDVFVRDLLLDTTILVSASSAGVILNSSSSEATISGNGRYVYFTSRSQFFPGQFGPPTLYRKDLLTSELTTVHVESSPGMFNGLSAATDFSGRYVAFQTRQSLVGEDPGLDDVYRLDMQTQTAILVSSRSPGNSQSIVSRLPSMSDDGQAILFSRNTEGLEELVWKNLVSNSVLVLSNPYPVITSMGGVLSPSGSHALYLTTQGNLGYHQVVHHSISSNTSNVMSLRQELAPHRAAGALDTSISTDGERVLFRSFSKLTSDSVEGGNYYIYNRSTGFIQRVPISLAHSGRISASGDYVVFASEDNTMVPGDTNNQLDVFRWNRTTNAIDRVSTNSSGGQLAGQSYHPKISADGRFVIFRSADSTLAANGQNHLFIKDMTTGSISLVDKNSSGQVANAFPSSSAISSDGNWVVFSSSANNLVPNDTNNLSDVFLYERQTQALTRISKSTSGGNALGNSVDVSISSDGSKVSYTSGASNLAPVDSNGYFDQFVWNRDTGVTTLVSQSILNVQGNGHVVSGSISDSGTHVSFSTNARHDPDDDNGSVDVYVKNLLTGSLTRVTNSGSPLNRGSTSGMFTPNGEVYFLSSSTNITIDDTSNIQDLYRVRINEQTLYPSISFSTASTSVSESRGTQSVIATLSLPLLLDLFVPIQFSGTASIDQDFSSPNRLLFRAGETTASMDVAITDDVRFEGATNETIQISIVPGVSYQLTSGSIASHTIEIVDNDSPPTVQFVQPTILVNESDGTVLIDVQSSSDTSLPIVLTLSISGTAVLGQDFSNVATTVTIPAGSRRVSIPVSLVNDSLPENAETIRLKIENAAGAAIGPNSLLEVVIRQNDNYVVSMTNTSLSLLESVGTITIHATLAEAPQTGLTVPFSVSGTLSSNEYMLSASSFVFVAGSANASVTLQITDDTVIEPTEFLNILVQPPVAQEFLLGSASSTSIEILDNDTPRVSFSSVNQNFWEDHGTAQLLVNLSMPSSNELRFPLLISQDDSLAGYATRTDDFTAPTEIVFPVGSTSSVISIPIVNDGINEVNEAIRLAIGGVSGTIVDATKGVSTLTIVDDDPFVSVIAPASLREDEVTTMFRLTLSAPLNRAISIPLSFSGSAAAFNDYRPGSSPITIPIGRTEVHVPVTILEDSYTEGDETITASISVGAGSGIAQPGASRASFQIYDDESIPSVFFRSSSNGSIYAENISRWEPIWLELSNPTTVPVYVDLAFSGSARLGTDYQVSGLQGTRFTLTPGSLYANFSLATLDDSIFEGDEQIVISIAGVTNATRSYSQLSSISRVIADNEKQSPTIPKRTFPTIPVPNVAPRGSTAPGALSIQVPVGAGPVSSPTSQPPRTIPTTTRTNRCSSSQLCIGAFQGLLSDATLFFDSNFDGVSSFLDRDANGVQGPNDPKEPTATTDEDGIANIVIGAEFDSNIDGIIGSTEGRLGLFGGTDTSIGRPWVIKMYAPTGYRSITPITNLIESASRTTGTGASLSQTTIVNALGLQGFDVVGANPLSELLAGDELSAKAYIRHVQIHTTSIQIAELLAGLQQNRQRVSAIYDVVTEELARRLVTPNETAAFGQSAWLAGLARGVASRLGLILPAASIDAVSERLAYSLKLLESFQMRQFTNAEAYAEQILKTKRVLQGEMTDSISSVGQGSLAPTAFLNEYDNALLNSKIIAAVVDTISPPVLQISDAGFLEGNGTDLGYLTFAVYLDGKHQSEVRADYFAASDTAELGVDFLPISGTLVWPAGDNSVKQIQVPILKDSQFENDESMRVLLRSTSKVAMRRDEGIGYIYNDDIGNFSAGPSLNTRNRFQVAVHNESYKILANDELIAESQFNFPLTMQLNGSNDKSDDFRFDFSWDEYRNDLYTVTGGTGNYTDSLQFIAGRFKSITHELDQFNAGSTRLTPESNRVFGVDWSQLESATLGVSAVDELSIVIDFVTPTVQIVDADPAAPGRMLIRSVTNAFAPIEFTNPTVKLKVYSRDPAQIQTISLDPAFAGSIELLSSLRSPSEIALSSTSTLENVPIGAVIASLSSVDPNEGETFSYSLVTGNGSSDNASFIIDGGSLKTATNINFESKSNYSIRIRSTDSVGMFTEQSFVITVTNVNEAPIAVADLRSGTTLAIHALNLLANDSDPDTNTLLSVTHVNGNPIAPGQSVLLTHGTLEMNSRSGNVQFHYYPYGTTGVESFTYTISDGSLVSTTGVTLNLLGANSPPVANPDSYGAPGALVLEDVILTVPAASGVLANDTDPNGDTLFALLESQPSKGTVSLLGNGGFTFTPTPNATGQTTFTYRALDNKGGDAIGTATITITNVNDAPSGTDKTINRTFDPVTQATDTVFSEADFGFSDLLDEPNVNTLSGVKIKSLPAAGRGTLKLDGTPITAVDTIVLATDIAANKLTFTPAINGFGTNYVGFDFQVIDNGSTANNGIDTDPTSNRISFNMSSTDTTGPRVTGVFVAGSLWNPLMRDFIDGGTGGLARGYAMPTGVNQTRVLTWNNIDQIVIQFSEDIANSLNISDIDITGIAGVRADNSTGTIPSVLGVSYDSGTFIATVTLKSVLDPSTISFSIDASGVTDASGNLLNGEWQNGVSVQSGDSLNGGNFSYAMHILPGDLNFDGFVNALDQPIISGAPRGYTNPQYVLARDINGDGVVNTTDKDLVARRVGSRRVP